MNEQREPEVGLDKSWSLGDGDLEDGHGGPAFYDGTLIHGASLGAADYDDDVVFEGIRAPSPGRRIVPSAELDAPPFTTLAESHVPPVRVRFTAPADLLTEGSETPVQGAILNLSILGLACVAETELSAGQRVWARFRLSFASEPLALLCVVLWRRENDAGQPLYGLQFARLEDGERQAIEQIVHERADGRAAEWPLPVLPDSAPRVESRNSGAWMSAAGGVVAGVMLSLVVSALPNFAVADGTVEEPQARGASADVLEGSAEERESAADAAEEETTASPKAAAVGGIRIGSDAEDEEGAELEIEPVRVEPAPNATPLADAPQVVEVGEKGLEFALLTDGPVSDYRSFWLDSPSRFVVDVLYRDSGFEAASYDLDHPAVKRIRVGAHSDKVRFVVEVADTLSPEAALEVVENRIVVRLERR